MDPIQQHLFDFIIFQFILNIMLILVIIYVVNRSNYRQRIIDTIDERMNIPNFLMYYEVAKHKI